VGTAQQAGNSTFEDIYVGQSLSIGRKYPGKVSAIEKVTLGFQEEWSQIELPNLYRCKR
jgi:hypothetical protein